VARPGRHRPRRPLASRRPAARLAAIGDALRSPGAELRLRSIAVRIDARRGRNPPGFLVGSLADLMMDELATIPDARGCPGRGLLCGGGAQQDAALARVLASSVWFLRLIRSPRSFPAEPVADRHTLHSDARCAAHDAVGNAASCYSISIR
jgi:hypothetical protein